MKDISNSSSAANVVSRFTYLWRALLLVWHASKAMTVVWAVLVFLQGLIPAALMFLTKEVVDALATAMGAGATAESLKQVAVPAILLGGTILLQEVLSRAADWTKTAQAELVKDHISGLLHRQAYQVDLAFFESSENFNDLQRAKNSSTYSANLLGTLGNLLRVVVSLLAIAGMLIPYGWWVLAVLLVSVVPAFYVTLYYQMYQYEWWKERTDEQRHASYYDWLLTSYSSAAPEIRLFEQGPKLAGAYQQVRQRLRREYLGLIRKQNVAGLGAALLALVVTGGIMGWMVWRVMIGAATLGDVALFYQAFNQGQNSMRSLVGSAGQVHTSSFYLSHLFDFLELQPKVVSPRDAISIPDELHKGIRFRNVTFRYPGARRPVFQNFDLELPTGKTVAIVGPNGAGKSTMIKLMCRFYDPEDGAIEFDGVDIRRYDPQELQRRITVLFQNPMHYQDSLMHNIAVADSSAEPDLTRIQTSAQKAGAANLIDQLPNGYDTQLGYWFKDGTELSGGEWQRVALARAFYRQAPIVLLDEPTSFMDSWAENEWLDRFRQLVHDRTALIITHRFTTAMRADIIYVMDGGKLVESGTHHELIQHDGLYARSWKEQVRDSDGQFSRAV